MENVDWEAVARKLAQMYENATECHQCRVTRCADRSGECSDAVLEDAIEQLRMTDRTIITVFTHTDRYYMLLRGKDAGLSDAAIEQLSLFDKIPLILDVDETGRVTGCKLDELWLKTFMG